MKFCTTVVQLSPYPRAFCYYYIISFLNVQNFTSVYLDFGNLDF